MYVANDVGDDGIVNPFAATMSSAAASNICFMVGIGHYLLMWGWDWDAMMVIDGDGEGKSVPA